MIFGLSATRTLSILFISQPSCLIKSITFDNKNKLSAFFHFSSDGGKYFPMSPNESAPNNASIIE